MPHDTIVRQRWVLSLKFGPLCPDGMSVYEPVSGFWGHLAYYTLGWGATYSTGGFTYNVNTQGRISGVAPMTGMPPAVGMGGGSILRGFTQHGTNQAITRGFSTANILKITREGQAVGAMGRFGTQMRYTLGGNTAVVNSQGKVISVFSNTPGTANGLGRGHFIPFK